jgi:tRNA(adenine34) deaminase
VIYNPDMMERAFELAAEAEGDGNLPIAALIADGYGVITTGKNGVMSPIFHPGRHAEIAAMSRLEDKDIARLGELALYVTLEPCLMCIGSAVLHRIKTIFFAAHDPDRGATYLMPHIAERYPAKYLPNIVGPTAAQRGDELFEQARRIYRMVRPAK